MKANAVVMEQPRKLGLRALPLFSPDSPDNDPVGDDDVVVQVRYSGVSAGTERLIWSGEMPQFPGMGYPLVPGYESVGQVIDAGDRVQGYLGKDVFVPGASCFGEVRGLFGGSASRLIVPASRTVEISSAMGETGVLLALAATAQHALSGGARPELIIGHGALGRLLARLTVLAGGEPPVVWETHDDRMKGAEGYHVVAPQDDPRSDYKTIFDVSGDASQLDTLISRVARGGEIVLAGFYHQPLSFAFPAAFMKEARIRVAAEWNRDDMAEIIKHIEAEKLSLQGLVSHREPASNAPQAYDTAFSDPQCLKMVLDWRSCS